MATALSNLRPGHFNPNFFAYGQFPLYLGYVLLLLLQIPNNFANSVYILRFISAVTSCISLFYLLKIYNKLLPKQTLFLASLLFIFTPGLIQLAHFGTTESLLIMFFLALIFYSLQENFLLAGLLLGLTAAIKISGLMFAIFPFLLILVSTNRKFINLIKLILPVPLFYFLSSPYNFFDWPNFVSSMQYETAVATGKLAVFYTSQFQSTIPYLFQLKNIFPFAWGLPIFVLFFPALFYFLRINRSKKTLLILITSLFIFLYFGQIYVKWFRFMSPIFFLPSLLLPPFIQNFKSKFIQFFLTFFCILPGCLFMYRYFRSDTRVQASIWIENNLKGKILSEDRNVVSLPFNASSSQTIENLDLYDLDNNPSLVSNLSTALKNADYILIPSRRVFANQNNPSFPIANHYYTSLFSGYLGFKLLKEFSIYPPWLNDELNAEETFTVFDNPTIRVYGKI